MEFAQSQRSTVGVEWELGIVDETSGELCPLGTDIVRDLDDPRATKEFLRNTVEIVSGVHHTIPEAVAELDELKHRVIAAAAARGAAPIGSGTHPFSDWREQELNDDVRYSRVVERAGQWGRQLAIWGVHVHVGVESRDKVAPIINSVIEDSPVLLALSASSPYWCGEDTAFSSHRTLMFRQIPTGGLPPELSSWAEYEHAVEGMLKTGMIDSLSEIRWDMRPASAIGTVEIRVADGAVSSRHLAVVSALAHCLVEAESRRLDVEGPLDPALRLPSWFRRENTWRAARYGTGALLIVDRDGTERSLDDVISEHTERLLPVARDLGCEELLAKVPELARENAADRQRRVAAEHGGDLRAVVADLRAQLRDE